MVDININRATSKEVDATPIKDGQLLITTDLNLDNKLYADIEDKRVVIGGRSEAREISYKNNVTKLSADNVQEAIDSITATVKNKTTYIRENILSLSSITVSGTAHRIVNFSKDLYKYKFLVAEFTNSGRTGNLIIPIDFLTTTKQFNISQTDTLSTSVIGYSSFIFILNNTTKKMEYVMHAHGTWDGQKGSFSLYGYYEKQSTEYAKPPLTKEFVDSLPTENIDTNTIYFMQTDGLYNQYMYHNNEWVQVGGGVYADGNNIKY